MPAYRYNALDTNGKQRKGVLEADTPRHVRQLLRDQGLVPVDVDSIAGDKKAVGKTKTRSNRHAGASHTELALITRQLSTLIRAGMPLEQALKAVADQSNKDRNRNLLLATRTKVLEGLPLVAGLSEFPGTFSPLYQATVEAGEQSGHVDTVLDNLADYTETSNALRQKVMTAMIYPAILGIFALIIVVVLMVFVVPTVVQSYAHLGGDLPALTKFLVASSELLVNQWPVIITVLLAIILITVQTFKRPGPKRWLHRLILKIPLLGTLSRSANAARFTRTFSMLLSAGVPVLEALRISGEVMNNLPMRDAVGDAIVHVREGRAIHKALADCRLFAPMTVHLIANGEASGELEEMLRRAADHHEREVQTLTTSLTATFEPLMILVMGGLVATIVMGVMMPIFEMNKLLQ